MKTLVQSGLQSVILTFFTAFAPYQHSTFEFGLRTRSIHRCPVNWAERIVIAVRHRPSALNSCPALKLETPKDGRSGRTNSIAIPLEGITGEKSPYSTNQPSKKRIDWVPATFFRTSPGLSQLQITPCEMCPQDGSGHTLEKTMRTVRREEFGFVERFEKFVAMSDVKARKFFKRFRKPA